MFHLQDLEQVKKQNYFFNQKQKEYCKANNIKLRNQDYLSSQYFQYLTEEIQDKTQDSEIKTLFSLACDILIRHCMTHKSFIQYNLETKTEFYSYAQFRIFNYGLKTYNRKAGKAFVYLTSIINNSFKQIIKDDNKQKIMAYNLAKSEGLEGQIANMDKYSTLEFESQYFSFYEDTNSIINPPFVVDLFLKYKNIKPIRILNEENVPRFKRSYTEFDYFLEVKDGKGIIIEYIDLYKFNENNGTSKNYFKNRLIKARENGYQTFFVFSDEYNNDEENVWNALDLMIQLIKEEKTDYSKTVNPMKEYIKNEDFLDKLDEYKKSEPVWYLVKDNGYKREQSVQDVNVYLEEKNKNSNTTRIYDCGIIEL
jgi:hypothetical protein